MLLLGGSGGLITNPVTPPSSHRHPVSSIALGERPRVAVSCRFFNGNGYSSGMAHLGTGVDPLRRRHMVLADQANAGALPRLAALRQSRASDSRWVGAACLASGVGTEG